MPDLQAAHLRANDLARASRRRRDRVTL